MRSCKALGIKERRKRFGRKRLPLGALSLGPSTGFTLIELVIVLTLLAILMAAAIPSVRGLKDEQIAREPITALSKLAKETRLQAMKDKRPYQIAFTSKGYTATRYLSPYMQAGQLEAFVTKAENDIQQREEAGVPEAPTPDNSSGFANPAPTDKPVVSSYKEWTQSYTLPEGVHYGAQFWYEPEPTPIEGDTVRLWVFQPTGMVTPITISMQREAATFSATFSALTADIMKETSGKL